MPGMINNMRMNEETANGRVDERKGEVIKYLIIH
jgi:hypothetical protein